MTNETFSCTVKRCTDFEMNFLLAGEGLDNFWKVLVNGRNCAEEIPEQRFDLTQWYDSDDNSLGKTQTTKAAFIEG